jgi:hypothetical protein
MCSRQGKREMPPDTATATMTSLHEFNQAMVSINAGLKTAMEFNATQRYESSKPLREGDIKLPQFRRNGDTVVVSVRSKTVSVIVSVKNTTGNPMETFPNRYSNYIGASIQLAKDDVETLVANLKVTKEGETVDFYPPKEDLDSWTDAIAAAQFEALKGSHSDGGVEKRVWANSCNALSVAFNTLISTLMMNAMDDEENEGMRLCYANRAKVFHGHAEQTKWVFATTWRGACEMKVMVV